MRALAPDSARARRAYWLRAIRLDRGLTQGELARRVGVSTNAISRYECGHDDPSLDVLDRLLVALGCKYEDLRADHADAAVRPPAATTTIRHR